MGVRVGRTDGSWVEVDDNCTCFELTEPPGKFAGLGSDLKRLKSLTGIDIELVSWWDDMRAEVDMSFLEDVRWVKSLRVFVGPLHQTINLESIAALDLLETLDVNDYLNWDAKWIARTRLRSLSAYVPQIRNFSALSGLSALKTLKLRQYYASDLSWFGGFPELSELSIMGGRVGSAEGIQRLSALKKLELLSAGLKDPTAIAGCAKLDHLDLSSNRRIADLTFLSGLKDLSVLMLMGIPRVRSYEPLKELTKLKRLELSAKADDCDYSYIGRLTGVEHEFYSRPIAKLIGKPQTR